ncbi:hypothetical protein D1871_21190 [Nakamurella silvestris]|nr:hypothetical protein D1871_21190 [Nakamurella silvestris]
MFLDRLPPGLLIFLAGPQPGDPDPNNGKGPEWGKAAPVGLLIIVLIGVAIVFLVRSMNKHVKNLPASFDTVAVGGPAAGSGAVGSGAAGASADPKVSVTKASSDLASSDSGNAGRTDGGSAPSGGSSGTP